MMFLVSNLSSIVCHMVKCIRTSAYGNDGQQQAVDSTDKESSDRVHERIVAPNLRYFICHYFSFFLSEIK